MDSIIFNAIDTYYKVLAKRGYHNLTDTLRLLVLCFYRDFVFKDYRALLGREDYALIEKAINCLFNSTCLIPYTDYLKMGKLHLGEVTELTQRIKTLEDTEVVKAIDTESTEGSDVIIIAEDDE